MNDLLQKLEAAMNERERVASLALRWRKDFLERGRLETWTAKRYVNNETPPHYDYWAVEAHLGALKPQLVLRFDEFAGQLYAQFFAANGAPTVLRRVARDRKLLELAKVLREDYQDNAADHLIRLLAVDYEIEVGS